MKQSFYLFDNNDTTVADTAHARFFTNMHIDHMTTTTTQLLQTIISSSNQRTVNPLIN